MVLRVLLIRESRSLKEPTEVTELLLLVASRREATRLCSETCNAVAAVITDSRRRRHGSVDGTEPGFCVLGP